MTALSGGNHDVQIGNLPVATVRKGISRLGNFYFGGSLNILLFSKGMVSPAVQTRMGNQIGIINVGKAPPTPWSPVE